MAHTGVLALALFNMTIYATVNYFLNAVNGSVKTDHCVAPNDVRAIGCPSMSRCGASDVMPYAFITLQFPFVAIASLLSPFTQTAIFSTEARNMSVETTATIASFGGKLLKLAHKATSTNCEMKFNLYLPPQASESGKKIPVLFYLAGLTCTGDNCAEKGFFQHRASQKGIAVVYPDTSPSTLITPPLIPPVSTC